MDFTPEDTEAVRACLTQYQDNMLLELDKQGDEAAADRPGTARRCAGACGRSGHLRTERLAVRSGSSVAVRTLGARGRRRRAVADDASGRTAKVAARDDPG
jgi:hypothetical protein